MTGTGPGPGPGAGPATRPGAQPASPGLIVEEDGPVRIVRFNRPRTYNAIDRAMHHDLVEVWSRLEADPGARAVLLTGTGRAFSGGGDLDMVNAVHTDEVLREEIMRETRALILAMVDFRLPVVAAINGPAVGLGANVALMTDVVLMAEDAYLADPHVSLGLVAGDGGAAMWPVLASPIKLKEYLLTGDRISARAAEAMGMATRVVPNDQLLAEGLRVAHRLAGLPAQAAQDTKRAVNMHIASAVAGVIDYAISAETRSITSSEHHQLVAQVLARHAAKGQAATTEPGAVGS